MRALLPLLLCSALAAQGLTRAAWQARSGVPRVMWFGGYGDGQLIGGADATGQFRLALERTVQRGTFIAWGARHLGEARHSTVIRTRTYQAREVLVQACTHSACAVVGLEPHTGREVWRETGRYVRQAGVAIYIQHGERVVRRTIHTGQRTVQ